jgi:hypothetical protein
MPRISHRDVQWLSAVIAELYAPADMETFARRAVHGLRRLVAANRASIDPINAPLTRVTTIAGEGTPLLPGAEATVSRFLHEHPLVPYFSRYGGRRWRKTTDMTTRRAFRRTALYQEYYRHTGVEYQIGVMFRRPRDGFLALVMNRETRDFSERDRTVLDLLLPHFVQDAPRRPDSLSSRATSRGSSGELTWPMWASSCSIQSGRSAS